MLGRGRSCVPTFITTSITWGDDDFETDAATASDAAIKHAVEGWQNEEVQP